MRTTNEISVTADDLLRRANAFSVPVNVELVARNTGVQLHKEALDDEVSGMLVVKENAKHIVVNAAHHENRQRFTIAHELGHLLLHHGSGDQLFVDTKLVVYQRAGVPKASAYTSLESTTTPEQEREANLFAAGLLMPEPLLREFIDSRQLDIADEFDISLLASAFKVSEQAMSIRLQRLQFMSLMNDL